MLEDLYGVELAQNTLITGAGQDVLPALLTL